MSIKLNSKQSIRIIKTRKLRKLSQEKICFSLDVEQSNYSKMERGLLGFKQWQIENLEKQLDIKL